jgi:hypothetical protein
MFRKEYKKDFDSVTPDISLIETTAQKFSNNLAKKSSGIQKRFVAVVAAICLLMGGVFVTSNLNKPVFALVALAADSGDEYVKIEENIKVTLPFGKISRGDRDFYLDETGKKIYTYDVGFEHGGISVRGDNISYVKYTSDVGELRFFDSIAAKQMRQLEQDEKQKPEAMLHILEDSDSFVQVGKEITTSFHAELGAKSFDVNWLPWYAIDIVSEDGSVNFADLPSDNVTIEVHFKNGKTMTKYLKLSFNNDGNLTAEIITE